MTRPLEGPSKKATNTQDALRYVWTRPASRHLSFGWSVPYRIRGWHAGLRVPRRTPTQERCSSGMSGGDLFDIAAKLGEPGAEREQQVGDRSRALFRADSQVYPMVMSLIHAVRSLHVRGIAHGDISLENALLRGSQV